MLPGQADIQSQNQNEQGKDHAPEMALRFHIDSGFKGQRIEEQGSHRPQVAGGIQEVGVFVSFIVCGSEPPLHEWGGCGECEEWRSDLCCQEG